MFETIKFIVKRIFRKRRKREYYVLGYMKL